MKQLFTFFILTFFKVILKIERSIIAFTFALITNAPRLRSPRRGGEKMSNPFHKLFMKFPI